MDELGLTEVEDGLRALSEEKLVLEGGVLGLEHRVELLDERWPLCVGV